VHQAIGAGAIAATMGEINGSVPPIGKRNRHPIIGVLR
jgi:hypothetical protein